MFTWSRRQFFGTASSALALAAYAQPAKARHHSNTPTPLESGVVTVDGAWLGPAYWSNRPQDWERQGDWITCIAAGRGMEARTVNLLTREMVGGREGSIACDIALGDGPGSEGFAGFLIGIGGGKLHPLSASLAQRGSGAGGGIMAVVDEIGRPHFREHNDDAKPLAFAQLDAEMSGTGPVDTMRPMQVALKMQSRRGRNRVTLTVSQDGIERRSATMDGVPDDLLLGAVSLVSSPPPRQAGRVFSFRNIETSGARFAIHEDRAIGACVACLYSIGNDTLKLSAQFNALGPSIAQDATLEIRRPGGAWEQVGEERIGHGWAAIFRVEGWDASSPADYRVIWNGDEVYSGEIRQDPATKGKPCVINMQSCVLSVQQALEENKVRFFLPEEERYGRYSPLNFNYPHKDLVANSLAHDPDLVFVSGDQYYEHNPTRRATEDDAELDTLYRWLQWCISYAPLIKDRPTIILVDDHDVLQGNLWGDAGRTAPDLEETHGGYTKAPNLVRMVYRMQCGANPDPAEPEPVLNDIPVSYCAFEWGGTEFAIIEDRKWKTAPIQGPGLLGHVGQLIGERQEKFLADWAETRTDKPRVILTQSVWASIETEKDGHPLINFDGNGYPALGRRRAVELAKKNGALLLSGDQHLTTLVRHGIDKHDDGPMQFTSPSGGTFWQRWYEPVAETPNGREGLEFTGDWRDAFGNPVRVLAVCNPAVSYAAYREHVTSKSQVLHDRKLKKEGYGIVRVDHAAQAYDIECWEWNRDPVAEPDSQFPGWPYRMPFAEA